MQHDRCDIEQRTSWWSRHLCAFLCITLTAHIHPSTCSVFVSVYARVHSLRTFHRLIGATLNINKLVGIILHDKFDGNTSICSVRERACFAYRPHTILHNSAANRAVQCAQRPANEPSDQLAALLCIMVDSNTSQQSVCSCALVHTFMCVHGLGGRQLVDGDDASSGGGGGSGGRRTIGRIRGRRLVLDASAVRFHGGGGRRVGVLGLG